MTSPLEIVQDIKSPEDAKDFKRSLEYQYPHCENGSAEQAIALRAFALFDDILARNDNV